MTVTTSMRLLVLAVSLLAQCSAAQSAPAISGVVVDEKGEPVAAARVQADPAGGMPQSDIVHEAETDNDGHFTLSGLNLLTYKLFAMKEAANYPNTAFAFYSHQVFPTVTLTETAPTANVIVKVGPPAAIIRGGVTDAVTGKPVDVSVLMRRVSNPEEWFSVGQRSNYRVLVPPNADIVLEVSAPGYQTWYYGGANDPLKREPIRLECSKQMKLDIQLAPDGQRKDTAQ
jgi:hypothetical protein